MPRRDAYRKRALKAFEASTMMAVRKALRRGSMWLDHSLSYRDRDSMLIPANNDDLNDLLRSLAKLASIGAPTPEVGLVISCARCNIDIRP
jgi:hypothetical protein